MHLQPKLPFHWKGHRLPGCEPFSYEGRLGTLVVQQVAYPEFSLFFLQLQADRSFSLFAPLQKGWQSVLALKGKFPLLLQDKEYFLSDGQFLFLRGANGGEMELQASAADSLQVWVARYQPPFYKRWLHLFPRLATSAAHTVFPGLLAQPLPAHTTTLTAVRDLFYEKYAPHLKPAFRHLKTGEQFFGLANTAHNPAQGRIGTLWEQAVANRAHDLIMQDIRVHHTNEEIAARLGVDRKALNKAFRQLYGLGMKEYLTWVRLERSRELLLQGWPLKKVAVMVGYKYAATFSYEFRKYYHYSPVDFQNGQIK